MIRQATVQDLDRILEIYASARQFMRENGNPTQWGENHPPRELLEADIAAGQLFVCTQGDRVQAVFAFILGGDPTYGYIEDGAWLDDAPYGAVHRIASSGEVPGMFARCIDYCAQSCSSIRIDTHADNKIMQRLCEKYGFVRCGTIYIEDGSPRIAYHLQVGAV